MESLLDGLDKLMVRDNVSTIKEIIGIDNMKNNTIWLYVLISYNLLLI